MALQTDLSRSPYFDDYNVNKNFYQILYRPGVAVQTRELNQMQTILQDQINKFGRFVFKEGSVTEGCAFTFDDNYQYVKINDNYSNNYAFTITDFIGKVVTNDYGLKASIVNAIPGYQSQDPDLNTLYIKYLNTATDHLSNGYYQTAFANGDNLAITTTSGVPIGNVTTATVTNGTGTGYAFTTTAGTIFKKGYFITVEPQTILVSKYDNAPDGVSVGFDAVENIITPEADSSLYDNAAGSPNYTAPGAHRLQLIPTLVTRSTAAIANTTSFFSLCDFKSGKPVSIKSTPQLGALGAELAKRTYETNGNFVVYPFILSTESKSTTDANNSTYNNLVSSRGLGYVDGYRVEFVNNNKVDLRKGTDYESLKSQVVSANFGYYVYVSDYCGEFNTGSDIVELEIHSTEKNAVSQSTFLSGYSSSTKIGTAYARGFSYSSGMIGTPEATYILYLFNVQMLPGYNFSNARSIISYNGSSMLGVADIVTTYNAASNTYVASLQQSKYSNMVFPIGQKAIKPDGFDNTQYVYRDKASSSFSNTSVSTASMSVSLPGIPHGTATETINHIGTLTGASTLSFLVFPTTDGYSLPKTGTVNVATTATTNGSSNVTGNGTSFLTDYMVGDYIYIDGVKRIVNTIANNTFLTVTVPYANTFGPTTNTHQKAFPSNVPIDFTKSNGTINRSITTTSNTIVYTLGETVNGSFNATTYFDVLRSGTVPLKKSILKNVYVGINCANHSATTIGPWSLGVPDVNKINAIYISSGSFANSGVDFSSSFKLDNGQRDGYYDLASISLTTPGILDSTSRIIVDMDVFTYNYSSGAGFFNANSYPIDADTANTSAIRIQEIPQYTAQDGSVFDLRDCIDFRPWASNTATKAANSTSWTGVTVNPSSTLTFAIPLSSTYLPSPDNNFESDLQHYLGRVDKAIIRDDGTFTVLEGVPSNKPTPPLDQPASMTIGVINVPPYPSLSTPDAKKFGRYDYAITTSITQNKRYTMKDINTLSTKIDNLEYYTSLSLLEKNAKDTLVRSGTTGQNRFQNGMLVDSFAGHDIGNTQDQKYNIAIDSSKTELRPFFNYFNRPAKFNQAASTNVTKTGSMVSLNYEEVSYIKQAYATKYRNCIEGNVYTFKSDIFFDPPVQTMPDMNKAPDVVTNIDLASNFTALGKAGFATQWGSWNTKSVTTTSIGEASSTTSTTDIYGNIINNTNKQVTTTTDTTQKRVGQQLNVTSSTSNYSLGEKVTDIAILPYVKSINVKVSCQGLKPNTRVYMFMNNVDVTAWFTQYSDNTYTAITKYHSGIVPVGSSDTREGFYTHSTKGSIFGVLTIPPNTFRATTLEMKIVDVPNLVTGANAISTQGTGTFYASNLSVTKGENILSIAEPVLSIKEVTEEVTTTTVSKQNIISQEEVPNPNPDPPYYDPGGGCCFDPDAKVTMADGTYKRIADIVVGDKVKGLGGINTVVGTKSTTVGDRNMMKFKGYGFYSTDDHLFYTNNGWKTWRPDRLIDNNRDNAVFLEGENRHHGLDSDDMMVMSSGESIPYSDLSVEEHTFDADYVVYDLHLDGDMTYFVEDFVVHNCAGCCFDPETKVLMADGSWKRIADIEVGEYVVGSKGTNNKVVGTKTTTVADRKMVEIVGYGFFATDDHLFLTENGWKTWRPDRLIDNNRDNAVFLIGENRTTPINEDDVLIFRDKDGEKRVAYKDLEVRFHDFDSDFVVHDLHLDGDLTYITEGFVVHNCGGCGCCFDPDAKVAMADGSWKRIADIVEGDLVIGADNSINKVIGTKNTIVASRSMIKIKDTNFFATDDHLFLTDNGWKTWRPDRLIDNERANAKFLESDKPLVDEDKFIFYNNGTYEEKVNAGHEKHEFDPNYVVYDLHLDGNQTYIVEGFVVHNCTDGCSCFIAGSKVLMADGTTKNIEDVRVGESVVGAFGEVNEVIGLDYTILGNRKVFNINGEHYTTAEHPHISVDKKFYSIDVDDIYGEWGSTFPVILEDGSTEQLINVGLNKGRVNKLDVGIELKTVEGSKTLEKIEVLDMDHDTKLYNLVMGGSHTFTVDGYAVTGWPREDDFDYDTWESKGIQLTIDDYRINKKS